MADCRDSAEDSFILDPRHAQRLHQAYPDLDDWPRSWHVEPADILVGQQIVQVLMPFLLPRRTKTSVDSSFVWRGDDPPYPKSRRVLRVWITRARAHPLLLDPMWPTCQLLKGHKL
jgi:hypothetical protein